MTDLQREVLVEDDNGRYFRVLVEATDQEDAERRVAYIVDEDSARVIRRGASAGRRVYLDPSVDPDDYPELREMLRKMQVYGARIVGWPDAMKGRGDL